MFCPEWMGMLVRIANGEIKKIQCSVAHCSNYTGRTDAAVLRSSSHEVICHWNCKKKRGLPSTEHRP